MSESSKTNKNTSNPYKVVGKKQRKLLYRSHLDRVSLTEEELLMFVNTYCSIEDIDGIGEIKSAIEIIKQRIKRKNNIMSYLDVGDVLYLKKYVPTPVPNSNTYYTKTDTIKVVGNINIERGTFDAVEEAMIGIAPRTKTYSIYNCYVKSEIDL